MKLWKAAKNGMFWETYEEQRITCLHIELLIIMEVELVVYFEATIQADWL